MAAKAVFLDRDGTIIEDKEYLHLPSQVSFIPSAFTALKQLSNAGFQLFLVTNQSGVGRGFFTMADVERVHAFISQALAEHGVAFRHIYVAPEAPHQPSRGRKPSPQFLLDAAKQYDVDLGASYMVGDKAIDLECGINAGVRQVLLVRTGEGRKTEKSRAGVLECTVIVENIGQAAEWITNQQEKE